MPTEKLCKTIHQYSKTELPPETMKKLLEIAADYSMVKNTVYQRYGSIQSLSKLYPGYTVQNEMTKSGLRDCLGLPSVYFYLAVFEALGDIKTQWSRLKKEIQSSISKNPRFTAEDKHYLRFVLGTNNCLAGILCKTEIRLPKNLEQNYRTLIEDVDAENLNRYLCRQVRKRLVHLHTDKAEGFAVAERAYRYGKNDDVFGIFLSTKENRKRIFIPLTDNNSYQKQLYIKLKTDKNSLEIAVPIEVKIHKHLDYQQTIGLSVGKKRLFTTDRGNFYGEKFGILLQEYTEFLKQSADTWQREKEHNSGQKKYLDKKRRWKAKLDGYINQEINKMLLEEKPNIIYLPKLPQDLLPGKQKNQALIVEKYGFIKKRLQQKCKEQGIMIIEVFGKDISTQCSKCGAVDSYQKERFYCKVCGCQEDRKINAAKNALERGSNITCR